MQLALVAVLAVVVAQATQRQLALAVLAGFPAAAVAVRGQFQMGERPPQAVTALAVKSGSSPI
jgi:hypothetical protein